MRSRCKTQAQSISFVRADSTQTWSKSLSLPRNSVGAAGAVAGIEDCAADSARFLVPAGERYDRLRVGSKERVSVALPAFPTRS